jgi:rhodanese-related sulfurtransferase
MTANSGMYNGKRIVMEVEPSELQQWIKKGEPLLLVDVREEYEHDTFDIGGKLIPMGEVISKQNELPRNIKVVMYCRKGVRSAIVIQRLQDKFGFENLLNLKGGVENWIMQVHR